MSVKLYFFQPNKKLRLLWTKIYETLTLFGEKYEEDLDPFLEQFLVETFIDKVKVYSSERIK